MDIHISDSCSTFGVTGFLWIFQGFLRGVCAYFWVFGGVLLQNEDFILSGVILVEKHHLIVNSSRHFKWTELCDSQGKATVFDKWWPPKTNENSDKFVYFEFGVFWRGNVSFCGTLYPTGIVHRSVDVWWSALYSIPLQSRRICLHVNSDIDNYCCGPICCHHFPIPGSNAGKGQR